MTFRLSPSLRRSSRSHTLSLLPAPSRDLRRRSAADATPVGRHGENLLLGLRHVV